MTQQPDHPDRDGAPTPRWVKIFGLIALILVLLFAGIHLAGGGFRGHSLPTEHGVQTP